MDRNLNAMKHCWRSLYSKLCGITDVTEIEMRNELQLYLEQFKHALTVYDSPTDIWNFTIEKKAESNEIEMFKLKLIKTLQLEPNHTMAVFWNYLLHELRQSHSAIPELVRENEKGCLLSVWIFFAREKLFHLKCLHHILIQSANGKKYSAVFREFLNKFSISELYENSIKRFQCIFNLPPPSVDSNEEMASILTPYWIKYNLQEQIQLLRLIVVLYPSVPFQFKLLQHHFDVLKLTLLGTYQYYNVPDSRNLIQMQRMICFLMNFHILQLLKSGFRADIYDGNEEIFRENGILINSGNYRDEKGPLIASWILLKCYRLSAKNQMSKKEIAAEYGCCTVDLWKFLLVLLQSDLFQDSPDLFDLAAKICDEMVTLAFDYFGMDIFHDINTVVSLVCCLAKCKGFSNMPTSFKYVWDYCRNIFPQHMHQFFQLVNVMINCQYCNSIDDIVNEIGDLPYNVLDTHRRIKTVFFMKDLILGSAIQPLRFFPELIIHPGTHASYDYENNMLKLKKSVPIWNIIRNCLREYSSGNHPDHANDAVQCIKFCCNVLSHDARFIPEMFSCIEDTLQCLFGITTEKVNFDFVVACFELSTAVMSISSGDILNYYSTLQLLPDYMIDVKRDYANFASKYYVDSLLWSIIEVEGRTFETCSILMAYLKFLRNLISVNLDEGWYIMGGVTLIFRVLNELNKNVWRFKDAKDYYLIIWTSIQTLDEIITRGVNYALDKDKSDRLEDFKMRQKTNIYVPTIYFIAKHCVHVILIDGSQQIIQTVATMGETKLFQQIDNNASWSVGLSAMIVNTVNLSLSFLSRCLIFKEIVKTLEGSEMPKLPIGTIKSLYNPYRVFTYTYNCFSHNLKLLALKFLTQLADEQADCISFSSNFSMAHLVKELLSPLYSTDATFSYKITLLLFMAKCLENQKVIASILIDVEHIKRLIKLSQSKSGTGSIMTQITGNKNNLFSYVIQQLLNTFNANTVSEELHFALLKIILAVWKGDLYHLRPFFLLAPAFWNCLFKPFTQSPKSSFLGYSFIIDVINIEISRNVPVHKQLHTILQTFFDSEQFLIWMEHCLDVIDVPDTIGTVFKTIYVQPSALAKSWKQFLVIISIRMKDVIQNPAPIARLVLKRLVKTIASLKPTATFIYIADVYFLFLNVWKEKCSSDWLVDVNLACDLFQELVEFNSYYPEASNLYNTLILICCKIFTYGEEHLSKVINQRREIICNWFQFLIDNIFKASKSITNGTVDNVTLQLYISFIYNAFVTLKADMKNIILHSMKSTNIFKYLTDFILTTDKNEATFELLSLVIKFFKMILTQCESKSEFVNVDGFVLDLLCLISPTDFEMIKKNDDEQQLNVANWKFQLYGDLFDVITLLIPEIQVHTKEQLFPILVKHLEFTQYLLCSMTENSDEKCLKVIIPCLQLAKFVIDNKDIWLIKHSYVIIPLMIAIRIYTYSVISRLMHPIKICCTLYGVASSAELNKIFSDKNVSSDTSKTNINKVTIVYDRLLLIAKLGILILSELAIECELIWDMMWFGFPLNYSDFVSCLPFKRFNTTCVNLLPYLEWSEISLCISFIDQLQNASQRQKCDVQITIKESIEEMAPIVLYVNSKSLIVQSLMYFNSEMAKVFSFERFEHRSKQILATEIYLYMHDFITNVKPPQNNVNLTDSIRSMREGKNKLIWCFAKTERCNQQHSLVMNKKIANDKSWIIVNEDGNSNNLRLVPDDSQNTRHSLWTTDATFTRSTIGVELNFNEFCSSSGDNLSAIRNDSLNEAALYCATRFIYKLLLCYKYE